MHYTQHCFQNLNIHPPTILSFIPYEPHSSPAPLALFKDNFLSPHDALSFLMHIFILHSSRSPTQPLSPQVIPLSNCIITSLSLLALFMTLYLSLHKTLFSLSPQLSHFSAYPQFATVSTSIKQLSLAFLFLSSPIFHALSSCFAHSKYVYAE